MQSAKGKAKHCMMMDAPRGTAPGMPSVAIPTLRASTCITGNSIFKPSAVESIDHIEPILRSPRGWDDGDVVMIDDLVAGVQSCQGAADRAAERLRRERSAHIHQQQGASATIAPAAKPGRSRSPVPITERKPWGANAPTPRRSNSAPRDPPTASKPQTPRPSSATHAAQQQQQQRSTSTPHETPETTTRKPPVPKFPATTPPPTLRRAPNHAKNAATVAPRTTQRRGDVAAAPAAIIDAAAIETIQRLGAALAAARDDNAALATRVDQLESQLATNAEVHNEVERVLTDKLLLLTSQMHFCMTWIQQCDAAVVADECGKTSATPEPPEEAVACKLNYSSESATAGLSARLPPSQPIELRQK